MTFSLCGLGQSCSIATGKSSVARGILVRREILELALYTFKYVGGVKNVSRSCRRSGDQPARTRSTCRRATCQQQLKLPLAHTLSAKVPLPSTIAPREQQMIDSVLSPRVYKFSSRAGAARRRVLVLRPFKADQP